MLDNAIKFLTLVIVAVVAYTVVLSEPIEGRKPKARFVSSAIAGDMDVVTIEAEKPAKAEAAPSPSLSDMKSLLPLESYKPSVKSDATNDKIAALDERVTRLEAQYKTFSASKAGSGSSGGGSTGSTHSVTSSQSSAGYGSTGSSKTASYPSQSVPYYPATNYGTSIETHSWVPVANVQSKPRGFRKQQTSTCKVDQYGNVICK